MLRIAERALGLTEKTGRAFRFHLTFLPWRDRGSKASRDALFLDRYRAVDLPYVDIAIAALVGVAASLYLRIGHRTNLRNLQVGSLVFFGLTSLAFWLWAAITPSESGALFIIIYVWVGVFSVLAPSQVWTLAHTCSPRGASARLAYRQRRHLGWIVVVL